MSATDVRVQEAQGTPGSLAYNRLDRWGQIILDLIFPQVCVGCGRVDTLWCDRCQRALDDIPLAAPVHVVAPLAGVAATAVHEGTIQHLVWALKFDNGRALADRPLGQRLTRRLQALAWPVNLIVPVPLHPRRYAERGYNQAELLASAVARSTRLPLETQALRRTRATRSQVGLTADERRENMAAVFEADPQRCAGQVILLIDDVYTTGATMSAAAQALTDARASAIYALTLTAARG